MKKKYVFDISEEMFDRFSPFKKNNTKGSFQPFTNFFNFANIDDISIIKAIMQMIEIFSSFKEILNSLI